MYTSFKHIQILISLLKQYNVKHLVLSPGARCIPFVRSVEQDKDFICHSVVDERSAAFFALGIANQTNEIVAVACTSSTATCNYYSAVVEAYYQQVPLLLLTFDREQYLLEQMENQMIDQHNMYGRYCRKSVTLTYVENERDFSYCERIANEAFLELRHHGAGPVQINVEVYKSDLFNVQRLPKVKKIERYVAGEEMDDWIKKMDDIVNKRILFVFGQSNGISEKVTNLLNIFVERTNSVVVAEHMANVHTSKSILSYPITETIGIEKFLELTPDLVISYGGNVAGRMKDLLRNRGGQVEQWSIREDGKLVDQFKGLNVIFESTLEFFLSVANSRLEQNHGIVDNDSFYNVWRLYGDNTIVRETKYSNFYVAQQLAKKIEPESLLHTGILNSTRQMNFFKLADNIKYYSNVGAFGIDGSMSTFLGQASVTDSKCYLLLGDLSFLYDMNSVSLRDVGKNVRIIIVNNGGGGEFHFTYGLEHIPTLNKHISAGHEICFKGWVQSLGFEYFYAYNKEEFDEVIETFIAYDGDVPAVLEVFTDMSSDAQETKAIINELRIENIKEATERKVLNAGRKVLHTWQKNSMRNKDV